MSSSHQGKGMKDRSLNMRMPMTKQEMRKFKIMAQRMGVKGKMMKVSIRQ